MDLSSKAEPNHSVVVYSCLRDSLTGWWRKNQLRISWGLLIAPLAVAMLYGAFFKHLLPIFIVTAMSVFAAYLIYRTSFARLNIKSDEAEALVRLHLATAEALATAIDAKDQTTHCHVRRVQIYAAGMGEVFDLSKAEIDALKAAALLPPIAN